MTDLINKTLTRLLGEAARGDLNIDTALAGEVLRLREENARLRSKIAKQRAEIARLIAACARATRDYRSPCRPIEGYEIERGSPNA